MAVIQHHAKAQPRQTFLLPTNYDIHPSEHSSLLSRFIQLAPYLIQPGSSSALAPTLRHPDLSLGNILLAPGSTRIVSIIDWQDAVIYPRFMQAGYFAFCEHDSSRPQSLQIPSLPDHFNEMSVDKQSCFSPRRGQPLLHGRDRCKQRATPGCFVTSLSWNATVPPSPDRVPMGRRCNQLTCCISRHHDSVSLEQNILGSLSSRVQR
jgi:hypothetical protein